MAVAQAELQRSVTEKKPQTDGSTPAGGESSSAAPPEAEMEAVEEVDATDAMECGEEEEKEDDPESAPQDVS